MWSPDPACSSHGRLVNLTGIVGGGGGALTVGCYCDSEWAAGCDLFDLRLGNGIAMDCVIPDAAVIVFWAILLILGVARMGTLCLLAYQELDRLVARRANKNGSQTKVSRRFAMMALDFLVATPLIIASACLKLVDRQNNVLGTHLGVTLTLIFGVLLQTQIWAEFEIHQFGAIAAASFMGRHKEARRLVRIHSVLNRATAWAYFVLTIIPTVVALGLDHSLGPIASKEYVIVIVRNVGVMTWMALMTANQVILKKQIITVLEAVSTVGMPASPSHAAREALAPAASSTAAGEAKRMVSYFERVVTSTIRKALLVLLIYTIFSLPWAWPYQTFNMSFSAWLLQLDMNPARVTVNARWAAKRGTLSQKTSGKVANGETAEAEAPTFSSSSFSPRALFARRMVSFNNNTTTTNLQAAAQVNV